MRFTLLACVVVAGCGLDLVGLEPLAIDGGPDLDAASGSSTSSSSSSSSSSSGSNSGDDGGAIIEAGADSPTVNIAELSLGTSSPGPDLDLNAEGKTAWIHWGRDSELTVNERATAQGAIPTFAITNATDTVDLRTLGDNMTSFKWSGGTPKANEPGTKTGVYSKTGHPIFTLRRAVKTTDRMRMVIYASSYKALGRFTVKLDAKPAALSRSADLESAGKPGDKNYGRIAIDYRSSDPTTELIITWEMVEAHDPNNGNITLCAATLSQL